VAKSFAKHAHLKQDLTEARDLLTAIRDQLPIIDEGEKTTPNQRRAIRKAIMKSMAVWFSMLEHSNLPELLIKDRTYRIQRMLGELLSMMNNNTSPEVDGPTADDPEEKKLYLLDGDDR